ncbi:hypothetical protein RCL1_000728 [Eukaryota sp. TZLM3-RCL]
MNLTHHRQACSQGFHCSLLNGIPTAISPHFVGRRLASSLTPIASTHVPFTHSHNKLSLIPTLSFPKLRICIPRSCIVRGLSLHLEFLTKTVYTTTSEIDVLFVLISKFGCVSSYFRSLLPDILMFFFSTTMLSFEFPSHSSQLLFLKKLLPEFSPSIVYDCSNTTPLPRSLNFESVELTNYPTWSTENDVIDFIKHNNMVNTTQMSIQYPYTVSTSILAQNLPCLSSLVVTFFHDPVDDITLPSFTHLESLELILADRPLSIDLSLVSFVLSLSVKGSPLVLVSGISTMSKLTSLELDSVAVKDGLHPEVDLKSAIYSFISEESLTILLFKQSNYENCKISIGEYSHCSVAWNVCRQIFSLNIVWDENVARNFSKTRFTFSTINYPFIKDFSLNHDVPIDITLSSCCQLDSLTLRSDGPSVPSISLDPLLFLSSIELIMVNMSVLYLLLNHCPYVRQLKIQHLRPANILNQVSNVSLNYLRVFQINSVHNFLSVLPTMPRLLFMDLEHVADFSFDQLDSRFPYLSRLHLHECPLSGRLSTPNMTLLDLSITHPVCKTAHHDSFLANFHGLRNLIFIDTKFSQSISRLLIPPNLFSFKCDVPLDLIKDQLESSRILSLCGYLQVSKRSIKACKEWLSNLSSQRTDLYLNIEFSS